MIRTLYVSKPARHLVKRRAIVAGLVEERAYARMVNEGLLIRAAHGEEKYRELILEAAAVYDAVRPTFIEGGSDGDTVFGSPRWELPQDIVRMLMFVARGSRESVGIVLEDAITCAALVTEYLGEESKIVLVTTCLRELNELGIAMDGKAVA